MRPITMELRRTAGWAVCAALVGLAGAGCGADPDPQPSDSTRHEVDSAGTSDTALAISVQDPTGHTRLYTLTCDPDGGTHPMPELACRALASADNPFSPATDGTLGRHCYRLPSGYEAVVRGTWHGRAVSVTYDQSTSCARERWAAIAAVFVPINAFGGGVPFGG
jgi:hypothetical protein